eukprot:15443341-Alexandrium_andersonii.AAC.1
MALACTSSPPGLKDLRLTPNATSGHRTMSPDPCGGHCSNRDLGYRCGAAKQKPVPPNSR